MLIFFLVFCHVLNFDILKLNLIQIGIRNFEEKKVENEMNEKNLSFGSLKSKCEKTKAKTKALIESKCYNRTKGYFFSSLVLINIVMPGLYLTI